MMKILQANLNHARQAQDLFLQALAERDCGLGIVAEPYPGSTNPRHPQWMVSRCGLAAITWRKAANSPPCTRIEVGEGYAVVRWGSIVAVGVYLSLRLDSAQFARRLDAIGECLRGRLLLTCPVLVAGDFNAKSSLWGSLQPNAKGGILADWAAGLGLCLLNTGSRSTCVRPHGRSIVDLSWANPSAARLIRSWRVVAEAETVGSSIYRDGLRPHPP